MSPFVNNPRHVPVCIGQTKIYRNNQKPVSVVWGHSVNGTLKCYHITVITISGFCYIILFIKSLDGSIGEESSLVSLMLSCLIDIFLQQKAYVCMYNNVYNSKITWKVVWYWIDTVSINPYYNNAICKGTAKRSQIIKNQVMSFNFIEIWAIYFSFMFLSSIMSRLV